jgi:eukaryotic-like serine/threonine-protein kinase
LTEPDFPPANGEHIGPHRIVRALGRGGMGEVFLARDDRLNRWVAIKRIRHDGDTPNLRQRLLHEAHAVGGLRHPAIVLVYDLLEHEGDDCIVMEYVQGQTLAEALRGGPLDPALAVRLAAKIASGLAAAHEAGFLHRDLKAENVMVTPAKEVKILDFGLAKPIGLTADASSLTATGFVVGTRRSMSPEQARGCEVDERSDLYSLGILLYEMLTGSSPFQGAHSPATLTKLLRSSLPPRLVVLLERLLAQTPAARPQSAAEVTRELEAIAASLGPPGDFSSEETLSGLPTDAIRRWGGDTTPPLFPPVPAPTPPERSRPPRRRRLLMIAVLSALVVLVAAAIGLRHYWPARTKLLWVVVANPQGTGQDPQLQRAAAALVKANLKALGQLKGVVPIGPVVGPQNDDWTEAAAAEDLLTTTLERSGSQWYITLRRRRGSDGKASDDQGLRAPLDAQSLKGLDHLVEDRLRYLFPSSPPRDDVSRKEDYAAFFEIEQRIGEGQNPGESDLHELENLVKRSPNFLEAQLLEADVIVPTDPERASQLIRQAMKLAPTDPRPLQSEFKLQLAYHQRDQAAVTLSDLSDLEPGNPYLPALRAGLANEPADALHDLRRAVTCVPSWRNLLSLAKVEEKLGMAGDAQDALNAILRDSPSNVYASRRLAELDLDYRDPTDAERIYETLIEGSPTSIDYVNLGTARVLLHRYKEAIDAFSQALKRNPRDAATKLNLADAKLALGQKEEAKALYEQVRGQWEDDRQGLETTPADNMIKAQFLAHLGQTSEATDLVRNALKENKDNTDIIVSAAQVYTLAGDYEQAIATIPYAIEQHVGPNWFKLPVFSPLFNNPRYKKALDEALRDQTSESPAEKHAR